MIFTKDLMRSTKVIFIGDVYVAVALRGLTQLHGGKVWLGGVNNNSLTG
jgi:hypothetical protein